MKTTRQTKSERLPASAGSPGITANDLKRRGVSTRQIQAFKQMREPHLHEVTRVELDLAGFGQSLRRLREDADISLRDMARRIKLSPPFVSDCELGHRRLSMAHCLLFIMHCMKENTE